MNVSERFFIRLKTELNFFIRDKSQSLHRGEGKPFGFLIHYPSRFFFFVYTIVRVSPLYFFAEAARGFPFSPSLSPSLIKSFAMEHYPNAFENPNRAPELKVYGTCNEPWDSLWFLEILHEFLCVRDCQVLYLLCQTIRENLKEAYQSKILYRGIKDLQSRNLNNIKLIIEGGAYGKTVVGVLEGKQINVLQIKGMTKKDEDGTRQPPVCDVLLVITDLC